MKAPKEGNVQTVNPANPRFAKIVAPKKLGMIANITPNPT